MSDPFLQPDTISADEVLKRLSNYQFVKDRFHSDGIGHLQVETPIQTDNYNFSSLIHMVELKHLWPACIKLLSAKSDLWLMDFSTELQKENTKGVLNCLVSLSYFLATPTNQITHLQYAAQWPWIAGSTSLLNEVNKILTDIEQRLLKEDRLTAEIDLCIVRQTLVALEPIKAKV